MFATHAFVTVECFQGSNRRHTDVKQNKTDRQTSKFSKDKIIFIFVMTHMKRITRNKMNIT